MSNTKLMIQQEISTLIDKLRTSGQRVQAGQWQGGKKYEEWFMSVLYNQQLIIYIPKEPVVLAKSVQGNTEWAEEHFQERVGGIPTNPGESYKRWPYATFDSERDPYMEGKEFSHTYQERFWPNKAGFSAGEPNYGIRYQFGDLGDVIRQLRNNKFTRQAYLPIFFPEDTGAIGNIRVPCTLGYYFWINPLNKMLECNYMIRSCDALRHFRNDIYLAGRLMQHIAEELNLKQGPGKLTMYIFNFHVFENDKYPLEKKETHLKTIRDANN